MNNSLSRLIDGMVATLRNEVIPHVEGDYARGQAFGVIYMLNSLKLRASWSNAFLVEQLRALETASRALADIAATSGRAAARCARAGRTCLTPPTCRRCATRATADVRVDRLAGDQPRRSAGAKRWRAPRRSSTSISIVNRNSNSRLAPSRCSSNCPVARRRGSMLSKQDDFLGHQLPTTFDHVMSSDPCLDGAALVHRASRPRRRFHLRHRPRLASQPQRDGRFRRRRLRRQTV